MRTYFETELGKLYHGDCLEVMQFLITEAVKVDAIITDPPYGTTNCSWDTVIPLDSMWKLLELIKKNNKTPIVLFGNEPFSSNLRVSNLKDYKYDWKWEKTTPTGFLNANKQPLRVVEDIMVFYTNQNCYNPKKTTGERKVVKAKSKSSKVETVNDYKLTDYDSIERFPTNIIKVANDKQNSSLHPTQKPLELIKYLIETYSNKDDLILDFTSGSGTLAEACEQLGRKWICIEQDQNYCDITVKRLSEIQQTLF